MIWNNMLMAAGSGPKIPPVFRASEIGSSASAAVVVNNPAGVVAGDFLLAVLSNSVAGATLTPPAGWTVLFTQSGTGLTVVVCWKIATTSEPTSHTFTWSSASATVATILAYEGAVSASTVGVFTSGTGSATATAASITPIDVGVLVGIFASAAIANVSTPPSGMTARTVITGTILAVYDLTPSLAVASGSKALTWSKSGALTSGLLQITR